MGHKPSTIFAACARAPSEQTLRDERPPAASGAHDVDRASAALENLDRGDADFGIVMIGEGVVKE